METKINENVNFEGALIALKSGSRVARSGWNGKNMWVSKLDPYFNKQFDIVEKDIEGTLSPYLGLKTADNKYVPWLPSQSDLLAEDWNVLDPLKLEDLKITLCGCKVCGCAPARSSE